MSNARVEYSRTWALSRLAVPIAIACVYSVACGGAAAPVGEPEQAAGETAGGESVASGIASTNALPARPRLAVGSTVLARRGVDEDANDDGKPSADAGAPDAADASDAADQSDASVSDAADAAVCAVPPVGAPFFAIGNDSHWVSASNRCNSGAGGTLMTFTADRPQLVRMIKGHDLVLTQYDISTLEQGCTGAPSLV